MKKDHTRSLPSFQGNDVALFAQFLCPCHYSLTVRFLSLSSTPLSQQITLRFSCHYWQLVGLTLFHLSNNMNVLGSIYFPMDALFL
jgi:hypothetical protein